MIDRELYAQKLARFGKNMPATYKRSIESQDYPNLHTAIESQVSEDSIE
jgi:hypothetical protein